MKYIVKTLKEVRIVKEYSIEAESLQKARNIAWDLGDETINTHSSYELLDVHEDCSDFEILEAYKQENGN